MDSYLCRIVCAKRIEDHFLPRVDRSFAVKIHAVVRRGVGEVLTSVDRWPLLLRRCFCLRNNEGESRRRDSNLGFPAATRLSSPMIPPRLLSLRCRPVPQVLFRRFYSVCFRAPRPGRKSVGPSASARSNAVSATRSHDHPNEEEEERGGRRRDNDKCGRREEVKPPSPPKALPLPNRVCESPSMGLITPKPTQSLLHRVRPLHGDRPLHATTGQGESFNGE